MSFYRLINEQTGRDLFLDNENYPFSEIIRRSGISRATLERKRNRGVLWVYRSNNTLSKGAWVKYALQCNAPRKIPGGTLRSMVLRREISPE